MSKILISNPFLFPPSGDNEEEQALLQTRKEIVKNYYIYSINEFEKLWKTANEESSVNNANLDLWENISPILGLPLALANDTMDIDWGLEEMLGEEYTQLFSPYSSTDKDLTKDNTETENLATNDDSLDQMTESDPTFYNNSEFIKKFPDQSLTPEVTMNGNNPLWIGENMMDLDGLNNCSFNFLAEITANDPDPLELPSSSTQTSTINSTEANSLGLHVPQSSDQQADTTVKMEPVTPVSAKKFANTSLTKPRPRRKSVQTRRNIQDNTVTLAVFEEQEESSVDLVHQVMQPADEVKAGALGNLNGTEMRNRSDSTSSMATVVKIEPGTTSSLTKCKAMKAGEERKKRKYEEEDISDPSVKNARAAKANREKKKQELQKLQQENKGLKDDNAKLLKEFEDFKETSRKESREKDFRIDELTTLLNQERSKNFADSAQKVKMLDYVTQYINATKSLNSNQLPAVVLSQRLAVMPMPTPNEIQQIRCVQEPANFNISNIQGNSPGFMTFKVGLGSKPYLEIDAGLEPSSN